MDAAKAHVALKNADVRQILETTTEVGSSASLLLSEPKGDVQHASM